MSIVFIGCMGETTKLTGKLIVKDPDYEKLQVLTKTGGRRRIKPGTIQIHLDGSKKIFIKTKDDKDFWRMKFLSSLKPLKKNNEYFFSAKETGQIYGIGFKRVKKKVSSTEVKKRVRCWYPGKITEVGKDGIRVEKSQMIKGTQMALVNIDHLNEYFTVKFFHPKKDRTIASVNETDVEKIARRKSGQVIAKYLADPLKRQKETIIERYDRCRGKE